MSLFSVESKREEIRPYALVGESIELMHKPIKYVEKAASVAANVIWQAFDTLNQIKQNPGFTPKWSDKPLLKS